MGSSMLFASEDYEWNKSWFFRHSKKRHRVIEDEEESIGPPTEPSPL